MLRAAAAVLSMLCALSASPARAEDPAQPLEPAQGNAAAAKARFRKLDASGDRRLSFAEFSSADADMFHRMAGKDEAGISLERYLAFVCPPQAGSGKMDPKCAAERQAAFLKMDINGDRSLSIEEFTADSRREFDRLDKDRDGYLNVSEYLNRPSVRPGRGVLLRFPARSREKKAGREAAAP